MEHEEQVLAVKKALDLENTIDFRRHEVSIIEKQQFRAAPTPPVRRTVKREMPAIEDGVKFNFLLGLALIVFLPPIGIIYLIWYFKKKKETKAAIENSEEYKQKCLEATKEFDRMQAEYDAEYAAKIAEFNNVTMPAYKAELAKWSAEKEEDLEKSKACLARETKELADHYAATKIVPAQYRTIPALQYIYDMTSTSDYDVRAAIESYDKKTQRELEEERIRQQQLSNQLAADQNELLSEQNEISAKARRDANIASVVGAVQRHKTNSILKEFTKK